MHNFTIVALMYYKGFSGTTRALRLGALEVQLETGARVEHTVPSVVQGEVPIAIHEERCCSFLIQPEV